MSFQHAIFALAITLAPATTLAAEADPTPTRTVEGTTVISDLHPAVKVTVPQSAVFVGSVRWPLYDVVDAEIYLFVEADQDKVVERLYLIQFEAYLPSHPELKFDYPTSNPEKTDLGPFSVHVRPEFSTAKGGGDAPAGSDVGQMQKLLSDNGYTLPYGALSVRFVHLPTPDQRKELLMVYGETLVPAVLQINEAAAAGDKVIALDAVYDALIERGKAAFSIELLNDGKTAQ